MRERVIERFLHTEVARRRGTTRKMKGRIHDCDRLVIWPHGGLFKPSTASVHFVECKRPGGKARAGQLREHKRLRALGCEVYVLDTHERVLNYVRRNA